MFSVEKLTKKVRDFSVESRQNLAALANRQKRALHSGDLSIIDDLNKNGVHLTSIEQLFPDESANIMHVLNQAAKVLEIYDNQELPSHLQKMASSIDMSASYIISNFPEVFFLGISRRILDLVENYLGLPAAYHGVALRRSLPDGLELGPRLWHQDGEDFRIIRIVIYLTDVEIDGGPFEYIPRSYGLTYKDLKSLDSRIEQNDMLRVVPGTAMRQCYGKAGTVVISDAANTFHHEQLQKNKARSVAMYGFSSRLPKNLALSMRHFPVEMLKDQLNPMLNASQKSYVFGWRH